ncbi:MAG: hypothetical protein K0B37_15660 [Bacteroidales bacterium]|nr:hypothetical protein [Bacteroidales bacterium]
MENPDNNTLPLVSLCKGINPKVRDSVSVIVALNRIRDGASEKDVKAIRLLSEKSQRDALKKQLTSVVFQGQFSYRDKKHLLKASQLAILDADHVTDAPFYRDYLFNNYHFVFSSWISPSGDGVKFLCRIPEVNSDEEYKEYYRSLLVVFDDATTDTSNSDIARTCFESFDPDIRMREWDKTSVFDQKTETQSPPSGTQTSQKVADDPLQIAARMVQKAPDGTKYFTLLRASRLLGGYIAGKLLDETEAINLLESEIQKRNIDSFEIAQKAIRTGIEYGKLTPIYEDENNGSSPDTGQDNQKFWFVSKEGKISFNTVDLLNFLYSKGIYRYYQNTTDYIFIRVENNLVEQIDLPYIKKLLLNHILSFNDEKLERAFQYQIHKIAGQSNMQLLDHREIPIFKGEKDVAHIFFSDKICQITKERIVAIQYSEFPHLIWKSTIINRNIPFDQEGTSEFEMFLDNVFKDEASRKLIRQAIGYLLHKFKNRSFMPAVILNDNNEDDNSQGGTGKGIIRQALSYYLQTIIEDGKSFDFSRTFSYQNLNFDTQLFVIDDAKKHFNIEGLFSVISEGIFIEKKGKAPVRLEFEHMPKILITTNYAVKGSGESHKRRRLDIILDNHYSSKHTPMDDFGHMLFDDWANEQWNLFDCFMLRCINTYLCEGVQPIDNFNLRLKQFRIETHPDFDEFASELSLDTELNKTEQLEKWRKVSAKPDFSKRILTSWLKIYADLKGHSFTSNRKTDAYVLGTKS